MNKNKQDGEDVAIYLGMTSIVGDPRISKDNSYQIRVPNNTNLIIDTAGIDKIVGKGHFMNECWNEDKVSARIHPAPNELPYCIVSVIGNFKKNKELETTYGSDFCCKNINGTICRMQIRCWL